MKAFITGGTGLVGSHLIERLVKDGHEVKALVRKTSNTELLDSLGVEKCIGDVTETPEQLKKHIEGAEYVFHCAAIVDDWADKDVMYNVNVNGPENMIQACKSLPIKKFVFVSSMAVLGIKEQNNLDESAPYVYSGDNYNYTKMEAEKLVLRYMKEENFPAAIIRPPYIYGPRDRQFFPRLIQTLKDGSFKYVGDGTNPFSITYVGNVVEAMILAAKKELSPDDLFIITDEKTITRKELVEIICDEMGLPKPTDKVPFWIAKTACVIMEGICKLLHKPCKYINRFRLKFIHTPLTFDISKAKNVLGYKAVMPQEDALRMSIRWYVEHTKDETGQEEQES